MSNAALKSTGKKAPGARLQVREAANAQQLRKIMIFRNRIMVDELGISPSPVNNARHLEEMARDKIARHLFLTADNAIAGYLRLYTSDMLGPSQEMIGNYGLDAFAEFDAKCLSFTDHMVIAAGWRDGKVPALMRAAAFKLARNDGAHFDFTYCPPALVGLYEKIGYRCYSEN